MQLRRASLRGPGPEEDLEDAAVRVVEALPMPGNTLAIASERRGDELVLHLYTEGGGAAQAGVAHALTVIATCWQVTVESTGELGTPSTDQCSGALVSRAKPTEVVSFDDVDLSAR